MRRVRPWRGAGCGCGRWGNKVGRTARPRRGYRFSHALYQQVLYRRVAAARRVRLHQRIGTREEVGYGAQAGEMAAELAEHFWRGQDAWRAVHYSYQAAENALQRSAPVEALRHLTRGLDGLTPMPETPERLQHEIALQVLLGAAWAQTQRVVLPGSRTGICARPRVMSTPRGSTAVTGSAPGAVRACVTTGGVGRRRASWRWTCSLWLNGRLTLSSSCPHTLP